MDDWRSRAMSRTSLKRFKFNSGDSMPRRVVPLISLLATLAAACATHKPSASSPVQAGSHDMASMPGHDMAAMGSHSATETAFLFPDGNDRGWSKIENGSQHNMAPEVPLAKLPAETRAQLLH